MACDRRYAPPGSIAVVGSQRGARAVDSGSEQTRERGKGHDEVEVSARAASPRVVVDPSLVSHPLLRPLGFEAPREPASAAFLIGESGGALDLRPPGEHARPGIQAIFPPDRQGGVPGARRNPLLRAFGKRIDEILDLTAGLGADAYRLAAAGHRVRAYERDPVVHALLVSGWARARERGLVRDAIAARLQLEFGDGADAIESLEGLDGGVYIDPMYPPPRRRSAKPRRELQVLRAWLGGQQDAALLVERARVRAARVVVKRPHHAQPLAPSASFEIETKLVRFDVYVNPARMQSHPDE